MARMRASSEAVQKAAKELRGAMTPAERVLWDELRRRSVRGLRFRRQQPVDRFILDFYCAPCRLCVELDGPSHDQQRERDAERTAHLAARGITVLRFRNEEVLSNVHEVVRKIRLTADTLLIGDPEPDPDEA